MPPSFSQTQSTQKVKNDFQIKTDVLSELTFEPAVKVTDIGVRVKDGVVTLNGTTSTHGEKWYAIRAARRVAGVKGIADEINVNPSEPHRRTDAEIATAAVHLLEWSTNIPKGTAMVTVRDGWITLEGTVEWRYQKIAAETVLQHMMGIKGIKNEITIKPLISAENVEKAIKVAFERNALLDAKKVVVETLGCKVSLTGTVANNMERDEAERVAWAAPGVLSVDNQIKLELGWGMLT